MDVITASGGRAHVNDHDCAVDQQYDSAEGESTGRGAHFQYKEGKQAKHTGQCKMNKKDEQAWQENILQACAKAKACGIDRQIKRICNDDAGEIGLFFRAQKGCD